MYDALMHGTLTIALFFSFCLAVVIAEEQSPKELGYNFPDEWDERQGTMMIFPAKHSYGRATKGLREDFVRIASAIASNEAVHVFCYSSEKKLCEGMFKGVENVTIHAGNYTIDWARDTAPMVICNKEGKLASAGFRFNGWGKKYPEWRMDIKSRDRIAKAMGWPTFHSDFVLEGGAIEIGDGIGIVTESCVLNSNRTKWLKERVEKELMNMLGLNTIIWIKSGLMPDPITDGHVDGLLKFIAKDTVLLHTTDQKSDPNYQICQDAKKVLKDHGLTVIELPLAEDMIHMNFYIGSGGDIAYVPICGDPKQDQPALDIIGNHFKKVIPILANKIYKEGGGIHCYTQQIPK